MTQFRVITLSSLLLLLLASNRQSVVKADDDRDYTCDPNKDYVSSNECQTIGDGVCDDPNHGGNGGEACRNQDCLDCNFHCGAFDADCYGCVNAKGCYYCPGDGTCENSADWEPINKIAVCKERVDYLSSALGHTADACIADDAFTKDPSYAGSQWMFEMINLIEVWEDYGLTGKGITVRINDDGVYVDNKEFDGRFDDPDNSCADYLPNPGDDDGHGTGVAGIILGNANNDQCGVGIAYNAKFSACNFFTDAIRYSALAYKLETYDISQNSVGMPACLEEGTIKNDKNIIHDEGCAFTFDSKYNVCDTCEGEFTSDRSISTSCAKAIAKHCKDFYKEDTEACNDFPEIIVGGSCDYDKLPATAVTALELGIKQGRDGKGTIFTFASGNSFSNSDDVNYSGWTNSRFTISVGAVGKDGFHSDYSTSGAALMVVAPSGDNKDIGHLMTAGLGVDTCADSGQGTSFACPVVTGVIALILEANPDLTWRDVQGVLAQSSTNVEADTEDDTQTTNGAGVWHSNWYGFGIVNAKAAVEAAMDWKLYTEELQAVGMSKEENKELSDADGNKFVSTIKLNPSADNYPDDFVAESTAILLDLSHYNRGDLEIELESPSGTKSILHPGRMPENTQLTGEQRWKLTTLKNWGEDPTGTWKLKVRDLVDREDSLDKNIFRDWQLVVYGRSASGKDGFGVDDNSTSSQKSEFCLDPTADNPGCSLDSNDGNALCPAESQITLQNDTTLTVDAKIACPNDMLIEEGIGYIEASQRGLCTCQAALFDNDCDVIEEDLECECFVCPAGSAIGVAYSCNKEIVGGCSGFDCDANCNGEYKPPLMEVDTVLTKAPTDKPTEQKTTQTPTNRPSTPLRPDPSQKEEVMPTAAPINILETSDENLTCKKATPISLSLPPVEGTIRPIPLDAPEAPCLTGLESVGGWYQVIGNGNVFTLTACSLESSKSVGVSVFTESCSKSECLEHQSRQVAACGNGNGHSTSFSTEPNKAYNILVAGIPVGAPLPSSTDSLFSTFTNTRRLESNTDFRLELNEAEAPPNSKCGSAFPAAFEKPVLGNTLGLLTEFKTCHGSQKSGAWYTVEGKEPPGNDGIVVYEANTCNAGSNFYNTMSVFQGDSCSEHECVDVDVLPCPSGWFGQQVYWSTSKKENFQIFVHSSDSIEAETYNAGSFQIDLHTHARLPNDQCAAALRVESNRLQSVKSTTKGAKPDIDSIENSSCGTGGAGAWYTVRGTGSIMQASTCSDETNHKTGIQVYSGECGKLTCIDSAFGNKALCENGNGSVVNFKTNPGQDYYILVTNRREGRTGNFRFQVMETDTVNNDECSAAVALNKGKNSISGSTLQATIDFPPGEECVVPLDAPGVWYEIDGLGKGIEVSTCQSNEFDSAISVFKGGCTGMQCVAGSAAFNPKCTNGQGVVTSFYGERNTKYHVLVHGQSRSSLNIGDFTVSYSEFDILEANEFCPAAREVATDGTRIQGSTQDASHASIPVTSCGVEINNPGLWYKFRGNGQPFSISACSEDGDFDVSVSVFKGGPRGCDSLSCMTGTTFANVCSSAQARRFLQGGSSDAFRLMTDAGQDYFIFVHGTGVGDFDLYVRDENLTGFGTVAPTETPLKHGKDLYRWTPENTKVLDVPTDYFDLEVVSPPSDGEVTVSGYMLKYAPPEDFVGEVSMSVIGCNDGECRRFDVTIHVKGERVETDKDKGDEGWNKMWLLLLLLLLLIPIIALPFYFFCKKKDKNAAVESEDDDSRSDFIDDPFEKGLLPGQRRPASGRSEDWDSSDDDQDFEDGSIDSRDHESGSDDSGSDDDSSMDGSNDGFNDESKKRPWQTY